MGDTTTDVLVGWEKSHVLFDLALLETLAFQAKPNSIDKRNRNKKLNVIKNAKEGKVYNVWQGEIQAYQLYIIHRQVKLEHSNIFPVHNKQTWLFKY